MRVFNNNLETHPRGPRSSNKKKAVLIGATGATGKQLLRQLLDSDQWERVTSVSRRPVLNGKGHEKLNEIVVESFDSLSSTADAWTDHDVFFNCIGTTRKIAGGAKQFVDVEFGISLTAAKLAHEAGIPQASVISAGGANADQWAPEWLHPLLYAKTIGQKEETVTKHFSFQHVSIFRPGMLIRDYNKDSSFHRFFDSTNLGLPVDFLASAMIRDSESISQDTEIYEPVVYTGNGCIKSSIEI